MAVTSFASVLLLAMLLAGASASNWKPRVVRRPVPRKAFATGLQDKFYAGKCFSDDAEAIIKNAVVHAVSSDKTLAAGLLRMHFHDAFVRGTEASVLLKSPNNDSERNAIPNLSLRGFEVIDAAKAAVEKACPGVVSCADILALAARDSVEFIGGPWWSVPTGRRDGVESHASETIDLPPPSANISQLKTMFTNKGLNTVDLVALSGAHTIGRSHCGTFASRIYDSTGNPVVDPTLDQAYAGKLRTLCLPKSSGTVEMDFQSSLAFDQHYFTEVRAHRGLFKSDAALLNETFSSALVQFAAAGKVGTQAFFAQFAKSMTKLGQIGVLTGNAGQIREVCSLVKSS